MDELVIEEKKYVSSKRAAKMTGYAKDYIGQLCREGRVPARFVGRNWYVLESAIQDHRFGNEEIDTKPVTAPKTNEVDKTDIMAPTWESPRYEAISADVLPQINQLQTVEDGKQEEIPSQVSNLEESWQAWFNNFDNKTPAPTSEVGAPTESVGEIETETQEIEIEKDVSVPIHTVYQLPPEELLPKHSLEAKLLDEETVEAQKEVTKPRTGRGIAMTVQIVGGFLALISATTAIIGSGYLDTYISSSPFSIIAGIALYNK